MSILSNIIRHGNFTSSGIAALMSVGSRPMTEKELAEYKKEHPKSTKKNIDGGFGKAALTYIEEKKMERRLARSLNDESRAKALKWGNLVERYAFSKLGFEYELCSQQSIVHPTIQYWVGSPDAIVAPDTVVEIKCPFTLKSFCQLVQPIYDGLTGIDAINKIRETHPDGETYYWQKISNAILTGSKYAELDVFMPYESDLPEIKSLAEGDPDCYWIWAALEGELPFIKDGGYYKDMNTIRFEVPEADKWLLTRRVLEAGKILTSVPEPSVILATHQDGVTLIEPSK